MSVIRYLCAFIILIAGYGCKTKTEITETDPVKLWLTFEGKASMIWFSIEHA